MDEIFRVFDALQTADANACATPVNWQKGDPVIVPAPVTYDAANERAGKKGGGEMDVTDWYFTKRKLAPK